MTRPATLLIGIIAILGALGGAYALRMYMQPRPEPVVEEPAAPRVRPVPVASLDLPAGRVVRLGDIGLMPRESVEDLSANVMANPDDIIGRVLAEPMLTNQPFVTTNLFPQGEGPNLSEQLKPGLRALTVQVSELDMVGGYVVPGSVVDVLFRSTPREGQAGYEDIPEVTVTLATGVEILAVGENPALSNPADDGSDGESYNQVTLACSPDQANKLRAVLDRGEIALALWAEDSGQQPVSLDQGTTLERVLGVGPRKQAFHTEVYRRGRRTINKFEETDQVGRGMFTKVDGADPTETVVSKK